MSVWSKLFGGKSECATAQSNPEAAPSFAAPSLGQPTTIQVSAGKLSVTFHAHDTLEGTVGFFFTAVTRGLTAVGQRELVLTLRVDPAANEDVTGELREVSRFFSVVLGWACQRQFVDAGGVTQFGERALFGRSRGGLLYADARPIRGIELPHRALVAVVADEREVRTALDFGSYRILARLGDELRHFPFPLWSELSRPSVATLHENQSLLANIARTRAPGVSFVVDDERVRVTLSPSVRSLLGRGVAALPPGAPFALLTKPASSANAWLVWHSGQREPLSISMDGTVASRVTGSCLLIKPGGKEDQGRSFEDGYSLELSEKSSQLLASALRQAKALSIPMSGGVTLELGWVPDEPSGSAA